jgi:hypothetical protein
MVSLPGTTQLYGHGLPVKMQTIKVHAIAKQKGCAKQACLALLNAEIGEI